MHNIDHISSTNTSAHHGSPQSGPVRRKKRNFAGPRRPRDSPAKLRSSKPFSASWLVMVNGDESGDSPWL